MLRRLSISNLAVVESAEIEFGAGLNVITGETGAGKSVVMGAVALALGARADAEAVRDGAREARVEAAFGAVSPALAALLEEKGLPPCEDGELLVRRTVPVSGSSRVWVNDAPATAATLKELAALLVDIHGPNDNPRLAEEAFQRATVDACGVPAKLRDGYATAWHRLQDVRKRYDELAAGSAEEVAGEIERLRYAVDELNEAALSPEDDTELPARHAAAAHAAELVMDATAAADLLSGSEHPEAPSAADALIAANRHLSAMTRHCEEAAAWQTEISGLVERVQEVSRAVIDYATSLDASPGTLEALDARLSLVQRLKRKYGAASVADLLAVAERKAARLADLESRGETLERLAAEKEAAERDARLKGRALASARERVSDGLAASVTAELHGLGFLRAGFSTIVTDAEPAPSGCDRIEFLFAPNPGEPARRLADIASTGEIARVMLAVKTVTAAHDDTPTLIFDEIDSNIGGETGRAVGERLKRVSRKRQVIAITHLAQSAVYGDVHFAVVKRVSGGRTKTTVTALAGMPRTLEIARMLGGASTTVRGLASELLYAAQKFSQKEKEE